MSGPDYQRVWRQRLKRGEIQLPELDRDICASGGTEAQARAHRRRGEKPCPACLRAETEADARRKSARKAQRDVQSPQPDEMQNPEMNPFQALAESLRDEHWLDQAACSALTAELFWPDRGERVEPAKQICAGCPVRRECLAHAIAHNEREGVWGGLTPAERRKFRSVQIRPINEHLCVNGHNLDRVGTRADGYCKQCHRDRDQRYRDRRRQGLVPPRKPKRRERDITNPANHGLYRHNLGCRCLICCDANAEKQRQIRARKKLRNLSIVEDIA